MRNIKFRGIAVWNKQWVYGLPRIRDGVSHGIIEESNSAGHDVEIETITQYTGFKDSNGVEIYEGDIIEKFEDNHSKFSGVYQIEWKRAGFYIRRGNNLVTFGVKIARSCRVIGNIYDGNK